MKVKGVNLGNWLVLEKWMSKELFEGLPPDVEDESAFYEVLSSEEAHIRLHMHRSYYIQERDFQRIHAMGLNLVRIPVPHFIFGDCPPGIGCIQFLDKAFDWAEKYGLKILIDLHTAPDGQNGFDNSGLSGIVKWHLKAENIVFMLSVLERLAKRYSQKKALYGIELLNEPISEELMKQLMPRYQPRHPEQAEGSEAVPMDVLKEFYRKGYEIIRRYCPAEIFVVIHDAFQLNEWDDFMPKSEYPNLVIDTHMYLFSVESHMKKKSLSDYEVVIQDKFKKSLIQAQKFHPVIVGEWCIANKCSDMLDENKAYIYTQIAKWEMEAWSVCEGWIFWSYKLHAAGRNDWDYQRAVDNGWL